MVISEFITGADLKYFSGAPALMERVKSVAVIFSLFTHPKEIWLKLAVAGPLLSGMFTLMITCADGATEYAATIRLATTDPLMPIEVTAAVEVVLANRISRMTVRYPAELAV